MFILSNLIMQGIKLGKYKFIGKGSGRFVFDMNNGYVVKVAKNLAGREQNKVEYKISQDDETGMFAKVIQSFDDYNFIIMEKADKIYNMDYVWRYFNVNNERDFSMLYQIKQIRSRYNLLMGDLRKKSSWGIVDGRVVLIDYGFTRKVRDRYY